MDDRQAVPGLLSDADVLSATLRASCGSPSGLREASSRDKLRLPSFRKVRIRRMNFFFSGNCSFDDILVKIVNRHARINDHRLGRDPRRTPGEKKDSGIGRLLGG